MKKIRYILLLPLLWLSVCALRAQTDAIQAQRDSLIARLPHTEGIEKLNTYQALCALLFNYEKNSDLVLSYLEAYDEETRIQKDLTREAMLKQFIFGLLYNHRRYDDLIVRAPGYMQFLKEQKAWDRYFNIAPNLINAYIYTGKHEEALAMLDEIHQTAKQAAGYADAIPQAMLAAGNAYTRMERYEEAEQFFQKGFDSFEPGVPPTQCKMQIYFALVDKYLIHRKFDEAKELLAQWKKDLDLFTEEHGAQPIYKNMYLRMILVLYGELKEYDKVEYYCNLLEQSPSIDISTKHTLYNYRSKLAMHQKDWEAMLEYAKAGFEVAQSIGQAGSIKSFMLLQNIAYTRLGMPDEAWTAVEQYAQFSDSLYLADYNAQLDELRTQYEVERHIQEKEQNRNLFLLTLVVCIILAIALGIWIYYSRYILWKNRGLYLQIKEQDRIANQLNTITMQYSSMMKDNISGNLPGNIQQHKLVEQLREYLYTDRNFAKPDIDRSDIVTAISTNKTYLFEAVKAVTDKTLLEYINTIRIEEAKKLLENSPYLTVEAVSNQCGFNSTRTFYRFFRQQYNLSPTEYKRAAEGR